MLFRSFCGEFLPRCVQCLRRNKRGVVGVPSRTFLPVVTGAILILTLFFAAAAAAQETTTAETTTAETTTAETTTATAEAQETTTADDNNADGVSDADNFRCELFLRVVRDERGALRAQYAEDELIVQRFEQCVSGDVLVDTIPDRKLPFTGGMPLLGLAAIGLVALIAGIAVLRAVMRRAG
jgi:hypothetical protein